MSSTISILKDVFGFEAFRPGQEEIVSTVTNGRDILAIMPTGGGKSLCYQLPALLRDGVTVVISPLIALMRDQVRALKAVGVEAGALTSATSDEETRDVWNSAANGRLKLLYIAPERLASETSISMLKRFGVSMIAVDEAHCVSQWGHDFRPDYLRIGQLRQELNVPLSAFTATADEETRKEIVARLFDGKTPEVFLRGFDRPNIHLSFSPKKKSNTQILNFISNHPGQSGIIYCGTRKKCEQLAEVLNGRGLRACHYHGGMEPDSRRLVEARFNSEKGLIVVATVAFGMGIDKPDIRWVAHADLPKSIEAYYQEIGRAGRDGEPADTLTLFGADDIRLRRSQIFDGDAPEAHKAADNARLNSLLGLAEVHGCRRVTLLKYFGEQSEKCGNCDNCDFPPEVCDRTLEVRKALSAILRSRERFGASHIIDILTGNETEKIRQWNHNKLPTFGVGRDCDRKKWLGIFRQMLGQDLIRADNSRRGALRITELAHPVLRGEQRIMQRHYPSRPKNPVKMPNTPVFECNPDLLLKLKMKRTELANASNIPAYIIFSDRTLIEMAEHMPISTDQMSQIHGVGEIKLNKYGQIFLDVIANCQADRAID